METSSSTVIISGDEKVMPNEHQKLSYLCVKYFFYTFPPETGILYILPVPQISYGAYSTLSFPALGGFLSV